ncbi:MAG TPA: hypothetical protein VH417_06510 [Vicinamibacterales bacterium]|jgi:hypothetical protein
MSKHNNVNPDHYKAGHRDRSGTAVEKASQQSGIVKGEARERWLERERRPAEKGRAPRKA